MKRLCLLFCIALVSCQSGTEQSEEKEATERTEVQRIVDKAIEVSGGETYLNMRITFDFRNISYVGERKGGIYSYERLIQDSTAKIHDVLNNEGFVRKVNDQVIDVVDSMAQKYTNSVNSVLYFALLPYGLNDAAVYKKLIGESTINGKDYYKVRVTFEKEGGGVDYQDVFVYWINKETYFVDYLGYTYETDGGGIRFREAYNPRVINGIRLQDYVNYKPKEGVGTGIEDFDLLFLNGELEELSRIETENPEVISY